MRVATSMTRVNQGLPSAAPKLVDQDHVSQSVVDLEKLQRLGRTKALADWSEAVSCHLRPFASLDLQGWI
jgi:hypothetical protein